MGTFVICALVAGWTLHSEGASVEKDGTVYRITTKDGPIDMVQPIDAQAFRGRQLHFSARVKSEMTDGHGSLYVVVERPTKTEVYRPEDFQAISRDWTTLQVVADIPRDAQRIMLGVWQEEDDFRKSVILTNDPPTSTWFTDVTIDWTSAASASEKAEFYCREVYQGRQCGVGRSSYMVADGASDYLRASLLDPMPQPKLRYGIYRGGYMYNRRTGGVFRLR